MPSLPKPTRIFLFSNPKRGVTPTALFIFERG